jgi:hypothetical protein
MGKKDLHKLGKTPDGEDILEHPLASNLREDPAQHEHLVTLSGYPGHSSIAGHIRLYLHHDFQSYYEIATEDIRHTWPAITEETYEPVHVAIDAAAQPRLVVHTTISSTAASFLKGHLVSTFLATAIESASTPELLDKTPPPPPPPHGGILEPIRRRRGKKQPKPPE